MNDKPWGAGMPTKVAAVPAGDEEEAVPFVAPAARQNSPRRSWTTTVFGIQILLFLGAVISFTMSYKSFLAAAGVACVNAAVVDRRQGSSSSDVPNYYQTVPEQFPGPTATGAAPFSAETNPAPFASTSYIPNTPSETQVPISGNTNNSNIYQLHGQLSHYFPNPIGFGVNEYSSPAGAEIVELNMSSRHGSRYPTTGSGAFLFGQKHANMTGKANFTGELSFSNAWTYQLGAEISVPVGKQELFDSGVLHYYQYGHLYNNNNGSKIIARSTTQDRMTQSAEYFLAGFFGLTWTENATSVLQIENTTGVWNNTLAGYDNCKNANNGRSTGGTNATAEWAAVYLANATERFKASSPGFNWTVADSYNVQSLCAYETVAFGFSYFCGSFTYEEWEGYEYSVDISFAGNNAFQSPTGRGVGIGYVQEVLARLQKHVSAEPIGQINVTLDNNTQTFPLNQSLYFDFSHDTNIMSISTAFGFTQFDQYLPPTEIVPHDLIVSHSEPFGARLDIEIINTPSPVNASRSAVPLLGDGPPTTYIHFISNQRTLPSYKSFPACGVRDDGWCESTTFLEVQSASYEESQYDYACNGNYSVYPYGTITNGVPLTNETFTA